MRAKGIRIVKGHNNKTGGRNIGSRGSIMLPYRAYKDFTILLGSSLWSWPLRSFAVRHPQPPCYRCAATTCLSLRFNLQNKCTEFIQFMCFWTHYCSYNTPNQKSKKPVLKESKYTYFKTPRKIKIKNHIIDITLRIVTEVNICNYGVTNFCTTLGET